MTPNSCSQSSAKNCEESINGGSSTHNFPDMEKQRCARTLESRTGFEISMNPTWDNKLFTDDDNLKIVAEFFPDFLDTFRNLPHRAHAIR